MSGVWFLAAAVLDWLVGDPPRPTHPVVFMGRLTALFERLLWRPGIGLSQRQRGALLTLLVVGGTFTFTFNALVLKLLAPFRIGALLALWWLGSSLAARGLYDHALAVERRLCLHDLAGARLAVDREPVETHATPGVAMRSGAGSQRG